MRILLALDDGVKAQEKALDLACRTGAKLTVLFALDATWGAYLGHDWLSTSASWADFHDWMRDEEAKAADAAFAEFRQRAGAVPFTEKIAAGNVREEILREAAGHDLLIISTPFSRGLEGMRKGISAITEACPCDIMLVRR